MNESESRSVLSDSATPWIIESMKFSRPEYWIGLPFPSPGVLPIPGIEPRSPTVQVDSLLPEPQGKLCTMNNQLYFTVYREERNVGNDS